MRFNRTLTLIALPVLILALVNTDARAADSSVKQPVFVLCPHAGGYSAWSLYLMVDASDPKKVLSMGLEKLRKQNSKDSSYEAVVAAQRDDRVGREPVASINASEFGKSEMRVAKDDALHAGVTPNADGTYRLSVSLRISADERFSLGEGKNRTQVVLTYDAASKSWQAVTKDVYDDKGVRSDSASGAKMTGIIFPVTGTGIFTIVGMFDTGDSVTMLDRGGMSKSND